MGHLYIKPAIYETPWTIAMDETFTTYYEFVAGSNTYNGRTWWTSNLDKAHFVRAYYNSIPGLTINHIAGGHTSYDGPDRTVPCVRIQLNTIIPGLDFLKHIVYVITELHTVGEHNVDIGSAIEIDPATPRYHIRSCRMRWDITEAVRCYVTENSVAYQPAISVGCNASDNTLLFLLGIGQYSAYYYASYITDPLDSRWIQLVGNDLAIMANKGRHWHNCYLNLYCRSGSWSSSQQTIKRVTVGYKSLW